MVLGIKKGRAPVVAVIALSGALGAALGSPYAYAAQKHEKKHDEKKEVEALEEKWRTAQLAGDVATMDKMLADDFIGISMSGQVNTKSQQLERVRTRRVLISKIELSDMKVKLVGSVAIVTSVADVEGTSEGASVKGKYRYTRVYQRLPTGEWKITSFEATRILPPHSERNNLPSEPQPQSGGERTPPPAEPRFG